MKYALVNIILIFINLTQSQNIIGKIEGAQLLEHQEFYELIIKGDSGDYTSLYINKPSIDKTRFMSKFKKHVFRLFSEEEKNDFLLQFSNDSVYLIYENGKVKMEIWEKHNSDNRKSSRWFDYSEYLKLFGLTLNKNKI
ncbi:hypothetical protein [Psychroflexus tropicus]|uniref:hypothetical protein n=1 Tax=Psychroflexus tropicus TaxID=197345 RepID=UPI00036A0E79|nr:hypothetical protein [Psychroflexus tropicus]